ncbi:MAG: hypothetical protein IPG66_09980 [Hydrogenophilales bacterium]|nr:hypothetical protein [Hydrogenophilales bacterium]
MNKEDWDKLADQLAALPGGAVAALPDFFGNLVSDELAPITSDWDYDGWVLKDEGMLSLRLNDAVDGMRLFYVTEEGELGIARAGNELLQVAREKNVSALILLLVAIATGQVDDGRRLKVELPKIDAAAKDLMLMTVCRLCG